MYPSNSGDMIAYSSARAVLRNRRKEEMGDFSVRLVPKPHACLALPVAVIVPVGIEALQ